MSEKTCKKCKWFEYNEKETFSFLGKPISFKIGFCAIQPFDVADMEKDQMAVVCGHDGGIWVGEEFGCIHWDAKGGI